FTPEARQQLLNHRWPGNVRELKNVVERSVYRWDVEEPIGEIVLDPFASPYRPAARAPAAPAPQQTEGHPAEAQPADPHGTVTANDSATANGSSGSTTGASPSSVPEPAPVSLPMDLKEAVKTQEIAWLSEALAAANYNQRRAAELLSLTYHQLRGYIKKYQLLDRDSDD
ncbi:MAG: phage shock protein operon transcriptional activator, partial [Pseudomonadota bacterium]